MWWFLFQQPSSIGGRRQEEAERDSSRFWDQYESGIYRKPYLNEKAFISSIQRERTRDEPSDRRPEREREESPQMGPSRSGGNRPATPPVDYDTPIVNGLEKQMNGMYLADHQYRRQHHHAAAVHH